MVFGFLVLGKEVHDVKGFFRLLAGLSLPELLGYLDHHFKGPAHLGEGRLALFPVKDLRKPYFGRLKGLGEGVLKDLDLGLVGRKVGFLNFFLGFFLGTRGRDLACPGKGKLYGVRDLVPGNLLKEPF